MCSLFYTNIYSLHRIIPYSYGSDSYGCYCDDFSEALSFSTRLLTNGYHEWRSHEWKSLANHITSNPKMVIHGNECVILFLTRYLSRTHNLRSIAHFAIVAKDGLFWLWRHQSWSVTSRGREVRALWRHIRRLFLHPQIGPKAIFTSAQKPWISIFHHPVLTAQRVRIMIHIRSLQIDCVATLLAQRGVFQFNLFR